jgi:glycosyltransferase involved in cell wall biosynthesis
MTAGLMLERAQLPDGSELPTRIGVNAVFLTPRMGGLDTYVRELLPELLRAAPGVRFTVFTSREGERHLRQTDWASAVEFLVRPEFGIRGLKAFSELTLLGALASRHVDLLHSVALTAPAWTRAVNVVTIADVTWLLDRHPNLTFRLWRLVVPPVARRADRVIAISQASANHVVEHLRVPPDRIDVTLLGHAHRQRGALAPEEVRRRFGLGSGPIVLTVGARNRHKNLLRLLEAMPTVLASHPGAILVMAGNPTPHDRELTQQVERLQLSRNTVLLPFVDPAELEGLYAAARCFVLPSVNEGFGLPILEAMGRGVPVACSGVSALPEVAGEAALYFDPHNPEEIATALTKLLVDSRLRERLIALGRAREAELTWEATAASTLQSYARAWAGRRRPSKTQPAHARN